MTNKTVNDIRSEFLGFFKDKGHEVVPSSSLVPQNDPTLMFVNAGMVQFKDVFTGKETRPYTRAASSQKCVRAGGKHNDLDNVGYTARHHTFFEMLGNFSFGDYFKDDAIAFAWELVTKNFGLPADKLLVTVHSSDEEAAEIWKKVTGLNDNKIIRIPTSDNFWSMGDTGPCGPCTEIFFDHGDHIPGGPPGSPDEDGDRFIEIWNLVFMQFEQMASGERIDLPAPSVDTGMGIERIAAIMQGKHDNYDIDIFRALIEHSADITGIAPDGEQAMSHRVIADHLRCASFLIADGVLPSNEGRGFVLRRIMRRGIRHAHMLGAQDPMMYKLFPTLLAKMGEAYPELRRAESLITETLKMEETHFKKTLDQGLKLLDAKRREIQNEKLFEKRQSEDKSNRLDKPSVSYMQHEPSLEQSVKDPEIEPLLFPGKIAFELHDTYGFPVDLTRDALRAHNIAVDMDAFNACMEKQRADARKAWKGSGDTATEKLWFDLLDEIKPSEFLGYNDHVAEAEILAIIKDGQKVTSLKEGEEAQIITNQTPFYGESGGQVGDTGTIKTAGGGLFQVTDTQKQLGKLFVHIGTCGKGGLAVGDTVEMAIDRARRDAIRANHSATHLLHAALREHLGTHVTQKGSVVDENRLRFDISHPKALTAEEIRHIEDHVNQEIWANTEVSTRLMPQDEAIEAGAMALFGEKYDEEVRVLTMGTTGPDGKPFSIELCGGTHVRRTGDIGLFKITGESAVSAGVRRLESVTRQGAFEMLRDNSNRLQNVAGLLGTTAEQAADQAKKLLQDKRALEKQVTDIRRQMATGGGSTANDGNEGKDIGGVKFIAKVLDGFPPKDLKPMADDLKNRLGSGVVALVATNEGKASIVVGVTDDLTDRLNAVDLVKVGAEALGGKGGGGRPDMAQAGGPNADTANDAVNAIEKSLAS